MYCKRVKFFYPLVVTSFEDSVHELFCFHMYRPVQSREREEGQVCIVASVYGMIDCYCTLRFRYELINLDAMCCCCHPILCCLRRNVSLDTSLKTLQPGSQQ